jgi:hypothetical protein
MSSSTSKETTREWMIIHRARALTDMSIDSLRSMYAGYHCDHRPSQADVKSQTSGMTKGELVAGNLEYEFMD